MVGRGAETLVNRLTPCLDFSDRVTSYPQLRRQLALVRAAAPVTGGVSEAWRATATCAGWPFPAASRVPSRIVDGPRVLVLTSRYNAFSPPGHATLVARQFRHSTVVRTDKAMHASFFDPAVAKRTVAFLVDSTG